MVQKISETKSSEEVKMAKKSFLVTLIILILSFIIISPSIAAELEVAWDANTESDLERYTIYYGTSTGNYTHSINTKTDLTGRDPSCTTYDPFSSSCCRYTIKGLSEGETYYLAATASDEENNESAYSEELVHTFAAESTIEKGPKTLSDPTKFEKLPPINP
jgi:hypothetical protein